MVSPKVKAFVTSDQRKQDVVIADGACHCNEVRAETALVVAAIATDISNLQREVQQLRDVISMMQHP